MSAVSDSGIGRELLFKDASPPPGTVIKDKKSHSKKGVAKNDFLFSF